jgi:hypothetical protein
VRRFWNRRAGDDLEAKLRANRPQPRPDFVESVARRAHADGRHRAPASSRTALAGVVSALTVLAFTLAGGLGYAASGVDTVIDRAKDVVSPTSSPQAKGKPPPGETQYRPGKGCGDQNHIHERRHQCKVKVSDASVREGNSGTTNMVFTVSLDDSPLSAVTVAYSTANGTATAGSDYVATAGTLVFAIGQASATITVPVLGDTVVERSETVLVNLLSVSDNALIVDGQGVGRIIDDDK